jgi:two-component system, NtrC family, response regulator AtoC
MLTADVRLIAATNKRLEELVKAGTFREDLYYRLKVVEILMPPLRDRTADIPLLAQAFLKELAKENGKDLKGFTPDALETLMRHTWPGNVRELRTAIEHAVVFARNDRITPRDLPASVRAPVVSAETPGGISPETGPSAPELSVKEAEKQLIIRALQETGGNRTLAAQKLGMSRRTLHRKLHTYNLEGY